MTQKTDTNGRYNHGKEMGALQADVTNLKVDVEKIMTNHLPHIDIRLKSIEGTISRWGGIIVAVGVIGQTLLYFIK